jgi:hypothetical protein
MRLRFWRRRDSGPQWRDRQQARWELGPDDRKQDATIHTLRVPIGATDLERLNCSWA